jgi:replicative DNA helicase
MDNLKLEQKISETFYTPLNHQDEALTEFEEPIYYDNFPLPAFNPSVFPNWLKEYVTAVAESTQTPVDMAGMAAISVLSTAIAKKFEINPYGDWIEPLNTYCLTLMGPANRKSSVSREMSKPIIEFEKGEKSQMEFEILKRESSRRALIKRIEHLEGSFAKEGNDNILIEISIIQKELQELPELHIPTLITDDATPETLVTLLKQNQERIAIISAEAGIFDMIKGRYSSQANLEVYLKGHPGDYLRVDRRGRTESIDSPLITIGIFGQPDVIKDLPTVFQGRGLMARFLYALPKDNKGFRHIRPKTISKNLRERYNQAIKTLLAYPIEKPIVLSFDVEADILFEDLQERCEFHLREGGSLSNIPEWGGKFAGNIARIAGLLHVAEHVEMAADIKGVPLKISKVTVYKAIMLEEYFIQHGLAALGYMRQNPAFEDALYLLNVLKAKYEKLCESTGNDHTPLPYRELHQSVKNRFDSKRLNSLLKELEERGFVRKFQDKRALKPKLFLFINPYISRI